MIANNNSRPGGRKGWAAAVAALVRLGKAMPGDIADDLTDLVDINAPTPDGIGRNYVDRVPGRAEIPVSPTTSASGAGAEQLPRWSSDHAPQGGITELYNRFNELMAQFSELKKGQADLLIVFSVSSKPSSRRFRIAKATMKTATTTARKSKSKKALSGAGIRTGAIRDVLNAVRSTMI